MLLESGCDGHRSDRSEFRSTMLVVAVVAETAAAGAATAAADEGF
jgi:hypothetical protein